MSSIFSDPGIQDILKRGIQEWDDEWRPKADAVFARLWPGETQSAKDMAWYFWFIGSPMFGRPDTDRMTDDQIRNFGGDTTPNWDQEDQIQPTFSCFVNELRKQAGSR